MSGDLPSQKIYAIKQGVILVTYYCRDLPLLTIFNMRKSGDLNGKVHILLLDLTEERCMFCVGDDLVTYQAIKEEKK